MLSDSFSVVFIKVAFHPSAQIPFLPSAFSLSSQFFASHNFFHILCAYNLTDPHGTKRKKAGRSEPRKNNNSIIITSLQAQYSFTPSISPHVRLKKGGAHTKNDLSPSSGTLRRTGMAARSHSRLFWGGRSCRCPCSEVATTAREAHQRHSLSTPRWTITKLRLVSHDMASKHEGGCVFHHATEQRLPSDGRAALSMNVTETQPQEQSCKCPRLTGTRNIRVSKTYALSAAPIPLTPPCQVVAGRAQQCQPWNAPPSQAAWMDSSALAAVAAELWAPRVELLRNSARYDERIR